MDLDKLKKDWKQTDHLKTDISQDKIEKMMNYKTSPLIDKMNEYNKNGIATMLFLAIISSVLFKSLPKEILFTYMGGLVISLIIFMVAYIHFRRYQPEQMGIIETIQFVKNTKIYFWFSTLIESAVFLVFVVVVVKYKLMQHQWTSRDTIHLAIVLTLIIVIGMGISYWVHRRHIRDFRALSREIKEFKEENDNEE